MSRSTSTFCPSRCIEVSYPIELLQFWPFILACWFGKTKNPSRHFRKHHFNLFAIEVLLSFLSNLMVHSVPFLPQLSIGFHPLCIHSQEGRDYCKSNVGFGLQRARSTICFNRRVTVFHFEAYRPFRAFPSSIVIRVPSSTYWRSRNG